MKLLAILSSVVFVVVGGVVADSIAFKDCSGKNSTVQVIISPCTVQPCVFSHNVTANVNVTFKAPVDSSSLKAAIYGYVGVVKVKWLMPNPDGCKDSGITCPIKAGQQYTYTSTLPVPKGAPKIRLIVEWSLTSADNEKEFCFDFPVEID